jgi:hypothetical protein
MRLYRIGRFERGVFAEIGADRRATWQGLAIVVVASLAGGWHFLWKDGAWHVTDWLLDEGGTAIAATIAATLLFWAVARIAGGRGSIIALWRGVGAGGPPVRLGTYMYRYSFHDAPEISAGCSEASPCTVSGSTQLKPNLRSLGCRTKRPTYRWFTVVMTATATEFSGTYPVSDSRSIRVLCRAH